MDSKAFADAYIEGVSYSVSSASKPDWQQMSWNLATVVYDTRAQVKELQNLIQYMDDYVNETGGVTATCCRCKQKYDFEGNLSEYNPDQNWCGSGHGGAFHCAP